MADGWNGEPMEVKIGGSRAHRSALTGISVRWRSRVSVVRWSSRATRIAQIILKRKNQEIARIQSECGRLVSRVIEEAVARRSAGFGEVPFRQSDLEYAVLAVQIFWFWNDAACGRARTRIGRGFLREACGVLRREESGREKEKRKMERQRGNRAHEGLSQLRTETKHGLNYSPMSAFGAENQAPNGQDIAG